jgi:predicted acetyltransferase
MATVQDSWRIATEHSTFSKHAKASDGVTVRLAETEEAHRLLPQIYDRRRAHHPGFVDISEGRWTYILFDADRVRNGASGYFFAVAECDGRPDGYAVYRIRETGDFGASELHVWGAVSATDEADAALWRFLFDMDLVYTVTAGNRAVDDPTWWRLVDPRRLQRRREDGLWLKLLDPARALSERRYTVDGRLVVETHDGDRTATYEFEGGPEGGRCTSSRKSPDLSMTLGDLSSAYLGESQFVTLSRAGRLHESKAGTARRADLMFRTFPRPWSPYNF